MRCVVKKFALIVLIIICAFIINPWIYCFDNLNCASKIAGFDFPLVLSNYHVKAKRGMLAISYPLDEARNVVLSKSRSEFKTDNRPEWQEICFVDCVSAEALIKDNKIFLFYFGAESGYYSMRCDEGMTFDEAEGVYKMIADVEAPKLPAGV